jgi:hypothetical protein
MSINKRSKPYRVRYRPDERARCSGESTTSPLDGARTIDPLTAARVLGSVPRAGRLGVALVAAGALLAGFTAGATPGARPRVTNRCPLGALSLRRSDLPALRRFGILVAPHGVVRAGTRSIDYRDARAEAGFPTFYTGYVRTACPRADVRRVIARTADVSVSYPHVTWSASLSYSVFLVARTRRGFVAWGQMH